MFEELRSSSKTTMNRHQQQTGESTCSYFPADTNNFDRTFEDMIPINRSDSVSSTSSAGDCYTLQETTERTIAEAVTPRTPGLLAITPDPDEEFSRQTKCYKTDEITSDNNNNNNNNYCRSKFMANQKLAEIIFNHPKSLRNFLEPIFISCTKDVDDEALFEDYILDEDIMNHSLQLPLCVALETWYISKEMTLDFSFAIIRITASTVNGSVQFVVDRWQGVTRSNPMQYAYMIITRPFNMMGKTTEVVVSGIQSVATGVGSASSIALNRLSAKNHSFSSCGSPGGKSLLNQKILKKLSHQNSAAQVISYTELGNSDGGLSRHAKSRVQRMLHYDVSLRPFIATVQLQESFNKKSAPKDPFYNNGGDDSYSESSSPLDGPFMCTPQSFPPTPASRAHVLKSGSRFADDVVFLARDQLRVHDGLESSDETTREMAKALTQGKRLAVFDADDASAGIDLSCGQHVATKVGNLLYCSTRSMVPILRNCFVYFEMTVLGTSGAGFLPQPGMATLSFGLSTKEMPPNTLVGAWKGSVGLCTTGQILISGQWYSPGPNTTICPVGDRETVGCLVCLDDSSSFETWDGYHITATVSFNINGRIVSPHVSCFSTPGIDHNTPLPLSDAPTESIPESFSLPLLVPLEEELYPTLTLHSPGTSVMCRFSAEDIKARSRDEIGAPPNVAVYAVDGSLVFK